MKRLFCMLTLAILAVSCFKEAELGYPASVVFSSDGGMQHLVGDARFFSATIQNYKSGECSSYILIDDERYLEGVDQLELDWLRVEYVKGGVNEIKIYAEPNTTGDKRTLHIELYQANRYDVVKVTQNK